MEDQEAPWHVEVPQSQVSLLLGPGGATLQRLSKATGCELEVDRRKKRHTRAVEFQGQRQHVDEADDGGSSVKVFIRGAARRRLVAAEVLREVAAGDDPEDHAARAEGALVFEHDLTHPERLAWARWRLRTVAHARGLRSHLGRRTVRLMPRPGAQIALEEAAGLRALGEEVLQQAGALVEERVDALDELEPEEASTDPLMALFADQHGVIVRVCDQDDNVVSATITVRVFGPKDATEDAAALLRARFVDGKATACVLQLPGAVQGLATGTQDLKADLRALESECEVQVALGRTALLLSGADAEKVAEAKKTLQEILRFYMPGEFRLVEALSPGAVEALLQDDDLGALMARDDCVVAIDEADRSAWICGGRQEAVLGRVEEAKRQAESSQDGDQPAAKRRRVSALTFQSLTE